MDKEFFDEALGRSCENTDLIESSIGEFEDRTIEQIDTVERAILLIGIYELQSVADVTYRVVINEEVNLAKRFGAEDGYKYINALLDRASKKLRPAERS